LLKYILSRTSCKKNAYVLYYDGIRLFVAILVIIGLFKQIQGPIVELSGAGLFEMLIYTFMLSKTPYLFCRISCIAVESQYNEISECN
jgi:hypothetical protein